MLVLPVVVDTAGWPVNEKSRLSKIRFNWHEKMDPLLQSVDLIVRLD